MKKSGAHNVRAPKAKLGRPPVPKKLAKGSLLSVRLSENERRLLDQVAKRKGLKLSEWARRAMLAAAQDEDFGFSQ